MAAITSNSTLVNDTLVHFSPKPPFIMTVLVTVIPVATIAMNIPAVLLIIISAILKKKMKHFHLLSLGISDLFVGISSYLMAETYINHNTSYSYYNCWYRYYLFTVSFIAAILHVLGISIQRLRIIHLKIHSQSDQSVVQWTVILLSLAVSLSFSTLPFVLWNQPNTLQQCSIDMLFLGNTRKFMIYLGSIFGLTQITVFTTMCILYKFLYALKKKFPNSSWSKRDVRLCVTVAIIAVLFSICTIPLTISVLCYDFLDESRRTVRSICILFSLINSMINPIIYILRVPEFKRLLTKYRVCCKSNQVVHTDTDGQINAHGINPLHRSTEV